VSGTNHKSTFIFLGLGILFIIGSIPMFLLRQPLAVSHQAYKYASSSIEVITPEFGPLYGVLLLIVGGFFVWIFLRIREATRSDEVDLEKHKPKKRRS
jgi:hypothetical protein